MPSRSITIWTASSSPVPWMVKNTGRVGCSSSQALRMPSVITSVRAKAPQKLISSDLTSGLASTNSKAGLPRV